MKLLDLYCCQGGASTGFKKAGFNVTGVDLYPQPKYPYKFIQTDAVDYLLQHGHEYDFIHASPPCQKHSLSAMQFRLLGKEYPDLISATRAALIQIGKPYSLENVKGAPLHNPVLLCGNMFNIPSYRHRLFETNWLLPQPLHNRHEVRQAKMGRPVKDGEYIQYIGHFPMIKHVREFTGFNWMNTYGLAQSIPSEYTHYIGMQFSVRLAELAIEKILEW